MAGLRLLLSLEAFCSVESKIILLGTAVKGGIQGESRKVLCWLKAAMVDRYSEDGSLKIVKQTEEQKRKRNKEISRVGNLCHSDNESPRQESESQDDNTLVIYFVNRFVSKC